MKDEHPRNIPLKWLKCPACSRRNFHYRVKQESYTCRVCGCIFVAQWNLQKTKIVEMPGLIASKGRSDKNK